MQAVTTGAHRAVEFIKRHIKLEGVTKASVTDSKRVVEICTQYAQRGMFNIFLTVFFATIAFAFVEPYFFIGYLISIALFGLFQAIFMANAGGAWDNVKKIVEVELKQKGTPLHAATVIGDTVGDPFKDTSSVAMNPVIKFTTLFGLLAVQLALKLASEVGPGEPHARGDLLCGGGDVRVPVVLRHARRRRKVARPTMSLFTTKPIEQLRTEAQESGEHSLKRVLGPVNLITLGIGAIIGTGIFVLTGQAAAAYAGPGIVMSMILAGVVSALAGLCYAEFASTVPIAGSAYTYGYATLGEFFAWIIGWDLILEYALGSATVAVGWSGYLVSMLHDFGIQFPAALSAARGPTSPSGTAPS